MACGAGSGMLRDKKNCLRIIKSISEATSLPFSIKTRAGLTMDDKDEQFDFLVQASQYCYMIGIHGRVFKQGHSGEVDRPMMQKVKATVGDSCLIIGNGGIHSYQDHRDKAQEYGLDGIMTAQAAIANPRIFVDHTPSIEEKYQIILRHARLLAAYEIYWKDNL